MPRFLLGATVRRPGFAGYTWHLLSQQNCQQPPHRQKCRWLAGMSQDHTEYRVPFLAKVWASPLLEEGCPRWKSLVFPLEPGQDPGCHSGPAVPEGVTAPTVSPDPYVEALPPERLCLELGLEGDAPREMRP